MNIHLEKDVSNVVLRQKISQPRQQDHVHRKSDGNFGQNVISPHQKSSNQKTKNSLQVPGVLTKSHSVNMQDQNFKTSPNRRFTFNSQMFNINENHQPAQQLVDLGVGVDQKMLPFLDEDEKAKLKFYNQPEFEQSYYTSQPYFYSKHAATQSWKPLKGNSHLSPLEKTFLEAAERGDKFTLLRCLSLKPAINVNCMNMIGRTALQMAVDNENVEIVEELLKQEDIIIGDALLYAIQEGVYRIVEMLIDHPSITKDMLGTAWSTPSKKESHDFSSDISPVILAAICNQFEILQLLLTRGAQIERPHRLSCVCNKCHKLHKQDSFKHSLWRINSYKALASPAWISLTSSDPVLAAFRLSWELTNLAKIENEFKETFNSLSLQCRKYACDLLDQCRSTEEVLTVLNRKEEDSDDDDEDDSENDGDDCGVSSQENDTESYEDPLQAYHDDSESNNDPNKKSKGERNENISEDIPDIDYDGFLTSGAAYADDRSYHFQNKSNRFIVEYFKAIKAFFAPNSEHKLARLNLGIKFEQKRFVSHPHCQHILSTLWYDRLPGWRRHSVFLKILIILTYLLFIPICIPIYLIYPYGRVGFLLRSPMIKFINHSSSFAVFLILLLTASAKKSDSDEGERSMIRGPDPNIIELLILWWILGFIWAEMKQIWEEGHKAYVRQWWNWLDFLMLSLYLMTICLRGSALLMRRMNIYGFDKTARIFWPDDDPTLISEALFSIAHVFSFARIIFLFQVNEHLGPLQISLGNMLIDITKFIFIFVLIITSFACGIHQLFFYYNSKDKDFRPKTFRTLLSSYKTLFWCLFGVNHPDLNRVMDTNREEISSARITNIVGEVLLLVYHMMAIIVLVNMLIAMMSNSFQTIQNQADIEWKFARSKLWVGYFDEGSTLPPPFNTIISPKSIHRILRAFLQWLWREIFGRFFCYTRIGSKSSRQISGSNNIDVRDFEIQTEHHFNKMNAKRIKRERQKLKKQRENDRYQMIMRRLVRRYIHLAKKNMRQDGVNEDDLLEIKQDISSLRYELREDRKREIARSIGHLESIRSDIMNNLNKTHQNQSYSSKTNLMTQGCREDQYHRLARSRSDHEDVKNDEDMLPIPKERHTVKGSSDAFGGKMQQLYDEIKRLALTSSLYEADTNSELSNTRQNISIDKIQDFFYHDLKRDITDFLQKEMQSLRNDLISSQTAETLIVPPLASRKEKRDLGVDQESKDMSPS